MTILIILLLTTITLSFLCSLWESVLLSITPTYAQIKLYESPFIGKQLQAFKENVDRPLAAILILNTFAHTVGAIGVGEQAAMIWADTNYFITAIIVPIGMTLCILVLSEIIPKTLGANYWEELAPFTIYCLAILLKILFPLVWVCQLITKRFRRHHGKSIFSRSDFITLTEIGEQEGIFDESEADMIGGALDLRELRTVDLMRPASEIVMLGKEESIETVLAFVKKHLYSRYPVYDANSHEMVGIIHIKDLLVSVHGQEDLSNYIRPVLKVSYTLPIKNLLHHFREGYPHFALVYKGENLVGFVTLDNILQVFLGIIKDEFNLSHMDYFIHEDGSISARGTCSLYALGQALDKEIEAKEDIDTLSGMIMAVLERLPKEGEKIKFSEFSVRVEKMQGSNIRSVTIYPKKV